MRGVSPTLQQLEYLRNEVKTCPDLELLDLRKKIRMVYINAEKLCILFGFPDEGSIKEVVELKRQLDDYYCNRLIGLGAKVKELGKAKTNVC